MEFLLILTIGFMNIACFILGAKTAQRLIKGDEVQTPSLNPVKAVREAKEQKELRIEQEKYRNIMDNINNYNGTELGQKDVS